MVGRAILVGALLPAAACGGLADDRAVRLVEVYNERVIEAFRTADARVVEGVAGPREAKKLTGLVGVKLDQGVTLDAELRRLTVVGVGRQGGAVAVTTDERWRYQHRRIGSGELVAPPSDDHYRMLYLIRRPAGRWVVDEVRFLAPPEVGRPQGLAAVPSDFHGAAPQSQEARP